MQGWVKICLYISWFAHSNGWLETLFCFCSGFTLPAPVLLQSSHPFTASTFWVCWIYNTNTPSLCLEGAPFHFSKDLCSPGLKTSLWSSLLCRFVIILHYAAVVTDQSSCTACVRVIRLRSPVEGACPLTLGSGLRLQPQIMGHCVRLQEVESPQGCSLYHAKRQP